MSWDLGVHFAMAGALAVTSAVLLSIHLGLAAYGPHASRVAVYAGAAGLSLLAAHGLAAIAGWVALDTALLLLGTVAIALSIALGAKPRREPSA